MAENKEVKVKKMPVFLDAIRKSEKAKEIPVKLNGMRETTKELVEFLKTAKAQIHKLPCQDNKSANIVVSAIKRVSEKNGITRIGQITSRGNDVFVELK